MGKRTFVLLAPMVPALVAPCPANAQTADGGFPLNQLEPSPAGDRFFGIASPFVDGHLVPRATLLLDYAEQPLVLRDGESTQALVSGQWFLHLGGSLALWDRLLLSANLPIALWQNGENPTLGGITYTSPSGAALGDLRLGARVLTAGADGGPVQFAMGASVHVPTGDPGTFVGEGGFRVTPELSLGGRRPRFVWNAALRAVFRSTDNPATFNYGAGVAYVAAEPIQIGLEFHAATPLQKADVRFGEGQTIPRGLATNAEALLDVRGRLGSGLWLGVAAGPGLSDAIGTPFFRVIGMVGWSPEGKRAASSAP